MKTLIEPDNNKPLTKEELEEYEKLEKEFLGDLEKKTGIYAEEVKRNEQIGMVRETN